MKCSVPLQNIMFGKSHNFADTILSGIDFPKKKKTKIRKPLE